MSAVPERIVKGVWIPAEIWDAPDISWLDKCLLGEIDTLTKKNVGCFASNAYLAERFRRTPESIKVSLSQLRSKGYLVDLKRPPDCPHERLIAINPRLTGINRELIAINPKVNTHLPEGGVPYIRDLPDDFNYSAPDGADKEKPVRKSRKKETAPDPNFPLLVEAFTKGFEETFKTKYRFDGGRDGKAVKLLLAIGPVEMIMTVAREAWRRRNEPGGFHFQKATTIHGLNAYWNDINADLNSRAVAPLLRSFGPRPAVIANHANGF